MRKKSVLMLLSVVTVLFGCNPTDNVRYTINEEEYNALNQRMRESNYSIKGYDCDVDGVIDYSTGYSIRKVDCKNQSLIIQHFDKDGNLTLSDAYFMGPSGRYQYQFFCDVETGKWDVTGVEGEKFEASFSLDYEYGTMIFDENEKCYCCDLMETTLKEYDKLWFKDGVIDHFVSKSKLYDDCGNFIWGACVLYYYDIGSTVVEMPVKITMK